MIIDAYATDTTPSHEVRRRALEALAFTGEPMSEVTYDALQKRIKEYEAALKQARRDALEEAARYCEGNFDSEMRAYGDYFAEAIRALGEKP